MDIKEIVNRPYEYPISQEESLFVIREYIRIRKGVVINPEIDVRHGQMKAMIELQMMAEMSNHACLWLREYLN